MLKGMNKLFAPVRIVVEETSATVRKHGASSKVDPALMEIREAMKRGDLSVPPGVYRIEITRKGLFGYEYNLRSVD